MSALCLSRNKFKPIQEVASSLGDTGLVTLLQLSMNELAGTVLGRGSPEHCCVSSQRTVCSRQNSSLPRPGERHSYGLEV